MRATDCQDVEPADAEPAECGCGCEPGCSDASRDDAAGRLLPIEWQRLVSDGTTCPRCAGTADEVARAVMLLSEVLRPLGIQPSLETFEIDRAAFDAAPGESNRILIAGKPLEEWIGATSGASACCSVCGTSPCRTVELEGNTFEIIPATLIVKAGLVAAAALPDR